MLAAYCAMLTESVVMPSPGSLQLRNTIFAELDGAAISSAAAIERIDSAYGVNG